MQQWTLEPSMHCAAEHTEHLHLHKWRSVIQTSRITGAHLEWRNISQPEHPLQSIWSERKEETKEYLKYKKTISKNGTVCESRKRDRIPPKKLSCPNNERMSKSKRPSITTKHFQHSYVEYKENPIFGTLSLMLSFKSAPFKKPFQKNLSAWVMLERYSNTMKTLLNNIKRC